MKQTNTSPLNCEKINPSRFLSDGLLFQKLLRYRVVALITWIAVLVFFPLSFAHATPLLYIPNQNSNTVSVIDGRSYSAIKTITVSQEPYGVGVSPDGKTVFITNMADDSVSVIDTATNTVTNTISVGDFPFGVAVSPDGRYAYVANAADDNLSVIETSGYTVVANITVGDDPHGVVVHPDGSKLYVTNYFGSTVSVINTSTYNLIKTINVGTSPHGIAIHPSGSYVYTANVFGDSLSVISTSSNSVIKTISMGHYPFFPAIDPSGQYLYVSNHASNSVTVVDASSNTAVGNISVGSAPHGISLDSTGSRIYVANEGDNSISVIDTTSRTVVAMLPTGNRPVAFGDFVLDDSTAFYPSGEEAYLYEATYFPAMNKDLAAARPLGIGPVSYGLSTLKLMVGFDQFPGPVDIYVALHAPAIWPDILLLTPGMGLQPASQGIVPWKSGITGAVDEVLFGRIPMSALPPVTYNFYVLVTPAGSLENYCLWSTSFLGQYDIEDVVDTITSSFSGDKGFDAIMLAWDKGYSLRQIVDAAMSDRLQENGAIKDSSGGTEAPVNPPTGIIVPSSPVIEEYNLPATIESVTPGVIVQYSSGDGDFLSNLATIRESAKAAVHTAPDSEARSREILTIALSLLERGHSLPEAVTAIITRNVNIVASDGSYSPGEYCIVDDQGQVVSPINPCEQAEGVFTGNQGVSCTDNDQDDYYKEADCPQSIEFGKDCKDDNPNINPGAFEICGGNPGVDENCNDEINEVGCIQSAVTCADMGYEVCGDSCMPAGHVCCSSGGYCAPGETCCGEDHCTPPGGMCCGTHACDPGETCCGPGCMPAGNLCCGGFGHCPPGCTCDYEREGCLCQ